MTSSPHERNTNVVSDPTGDPPLISIIEAAMQARVSVELIRSFVLRCPKPKGRRKLKCYLIGDEEFFLAKDIDDYFRYLSDPWPKPPKGGRPHIPESIKLFIARESHFMCAICGKTSKCEVAHIEPVHITLNNSPENLIYLCPNHHTQYDSFERDNSLTVEQVQAVKETKQQATVRMLRQEHNYRLSFARAKQKIEKIERKTEFSSDEVGGEDLMAELIATDISIRKLKSDTDKASRKDRAMQEEEIDTILGGDDLPFGFESE